MAEAATSRMSAVREQHAAHPTRPKPASKPGGPSTANAARQGQRTSGNSSGRSGSVGRSGGGRSGGSSGGKSLPSGKEISLPAGKEISLPGGKDISLPGGKEISMLQPHLPIWTRLALKIAKRLAKHQLRRVAEAARGTLDGNGVLEGTAHDVLQKPREVLQKRPDNPVGALKPSLPIQQSVDIAVPLRFAWQRWMELDFLPEGVDRVVDIERGDGGLSGHLDGDPESTWSAEILDEREYESFAWRSTEGSDCAGLVTFHQLSDRLTRIELTLDVVPQTPADSARLLLHLADWRARREMRKFKADLEVVSPDVYADDEDSSSR